MSLMRPFRSDIYLALMTWDLPNTIDFCTSPISRDFDRLSRARYGMLWRVIIIRFFQQILCHVALDPGGGAGRLQKCFLAFCSMFSTSPAELLHLKFSKFCLILF